MKLLNLEVSGFRAFSAKHVLDLNADTIIVAGPNGQGKTSLFDAIFWAIAGSIPRLGDGGSVVSMFSDAGEARVALELSSHDGSSIRIVRSSDGEDSLLSLHVDGEALRGPEAEGRLFRILWPQALSATNPDEALIAALERGVYLQQDRVRDFIEAHTDHERFATVSELIGAGRITELQAALERSRRAWSQVTNTRGREAEDLRDRVDDLELQLTQLGSDPDVAVDTARWNQWWEAIERVGVLADPPSPDAPVAAARVEAAVREIVARRHLEDRQRQDAAYLQASLAELPTAPREDLEALRQQVATARGAAEQARAALADAEGYAAEVRRMQVEAEDAREQLRTFAQLALRHLGERCPVCEQKYDQVATRERLEGLAAETGAKAAEGLEEPNVSSAAALVQEHEKAEAAAAQALADAEARVRAWSSTLAELTTRGERFGLKADEFDEWPKRVEALLSEIEDRIEVCDQLARQGEEVALALVRSGQRARRAEIEREVAAMREALVAAEAEVAARERTTGLVAQIIDALRSASSDVVEAELLRIEPLLQRIYATADPHPAFRLVRLLSRMRQGRGRIVSQVEDPIRELPSESPGAVLSSSQMNVLAVSIFLALNLGMSSLPLKAAILDDPLQSLDDLNLLGLTDLLRRTRERRQLLVSTHDPRFSGLLERKLRPVREGQRTLVYSLEAWSPDGLDVSMREVERDQEPVRIAA